MDVLFQDHLQVMDLNIAPQNLPPKKNTKYLFEPQKVVLFVGMILCVFFPGFAIQVPFFVVGV